MILEKIGFVHIICVCLITIPIIFAQPDADFTFSDFDLTGETDQRLLSQIPVAASDTEIQWEVDGSGEEGSGMEGSGLEDLEGWDSLDYDDEPCEASGDQYFTCDNNEHCLEYEYRCDGVRHCLDGSDEEGCVYGPPQPRPPDPAPAVPTNPPIVYPNACLSGQWKCRDGTCVDWTEICNGYYTCPDNSDEENCLVYQCPPGTFKCDDGVCIPERLRCDNHEFCRDGSDERNCDSIGTVCSAYEFPCNDGTCVDARFRCDYQQQCSDGSDEWDCAFPVPLCSPDQFPCMDGPCIPGYLRCDNRRDCADGSDELGCTYVDIGCSPYEFQCGDGTCIPSELRCDNHYYCSDGSDESGCYSIIDRLCSRDEFKCGSGQCIPSYLRCDKHEYCTDGSDERGCYYSECLNDEWSCSDGACIPIIQRCDGYQSCNDYSDETDCLNHICQPGLFKCADGVCIPEYLRCDGDPFCRDSSDEWGCGEGPEPIRPTIPEIPSIDPVSLFTIPDFQIIEEGQETVFRCRDEGTLRANVRWFREGYLSLPMSATDIDGRLTISNTQLSDSGTYVCEATGVPPFVNNRKSVVYLQVQEYETQDLERPVCPQGYAMCASEDCIPMSSVCNGVYDCSDGSDEERCSKPYCEPNEFKCDNRKCVLQSWLCDQQDDCGDGSDERGCQEVDPSTGCKMDEFQCRSESMCIPRYLLCDRTVDCPDGTDEFGCTEPIIVELPVCSVVTQLRQTFSLFCRSMGFPNPTVVWRHNWANLPPSCTSESFFGYGVLTCTNVQLSHQGAYSCESINILGATLGTRDTIVLVEPATKESLTLVESLCN